MKAGAWLRKAVRACLLFAAISSVLVRGAGFSLPARADQAVSSCPGAAAASPGRNGHGVFFVRWARAHSLPHHVKARPRFWMLDPQTDGDEQAEVTVDDEFAPGPALTELCPHFAEWRLCKPDAHRANGFIHSKTKPPP